MARKALKPFKESTMKEFLDKYTGPDATHTGSEELTAYAQPLATAGVRNNNLYAILENYETMVQFSDSSAVANAKSIAAFANLWNAAGFFNTSAYNLKDIVSSDQNTGNITVDDTHHAELKAGFKNIITHVQDLLSIQGAILDKDVFNNNADTANPKIDIFLKAHKGQVAKIDGPWAVSGLQKLFGASSTVKASPTEAGYKQWAGGWLYAMNSRITDKEQNVLEPLLAKFYDDKYAIELYDAAGKFLPTVKGEAAAKSSTKGPSETDEQKDSRTQVATAVYGTQAVGRPISSAFAIVWATYAKLMEKNQDDLHVVKTPSQQDALAEKLATGFVTDLKAAAATENAKA